LKSGEQILVTKTLKEFDALLAPFDFLRIHQSHLINMTMIKEFNKTDGGFILMKDGGEIPVSTRKRSVLMERISQF
jgi:two-component system LytT family response regulator